MSDKKLYEVLELLESNGGPIPMSKAGVYLAISKGSIPAVKIGRRVFIPAWWVERMTREPLLEAKQA
ncbi:hypothetical protein [Acetonema longum]|uniref:Helix-turn-helix domain-containing protein n=1 Tax=Acetonema longum DSM 6540 TaxID=1009370 RepID=F7NEI0_9FIRM|nr:hypothetical protein [Acetonema longum]EGO65391.1 hypothetical protein ALO_02216 [Acetonema longum DSM 6540]